MSKTRFSIGSYELQLVGDALGNEIIIYDNKIVSEKRNFGLSSTHHFEASENGKTAKYEVTFKSDISGLVQYSVKRNNSLAKKGALSPVTLGLLKIFFFFIGFGFICDSLVKFFPGYIDFLVARYTPSELTLFYVELGINFIFGALFLIFAFFLKRILVQRLKLITTVLWVRIGMMIISSPLVLANLIEWQQILPYKIFFIFLRVSFIWLFWFLLMNCIEIAKELKLEASLQNNR
jgi:hypothetical protein